MQENQYALICRLQKPQGKVNVVIDTDTYNEIDDQYALSYLIKSGQKLNLEAIYAAPFFNEKSSSPEDGMEKSYHEIIKILDLLDRNDLQKKVFKGSTRYLPDEATPVHSSAADDLAARAMKYTPEEPLYVIAIAAITNIASAVLLNPAIKDRIVIIWLGGNSYSWHDNREFNLSQDIAAARVVFDSGAAMVQLPCMGVVSALRTTGPELQYWLKGKNKLCDYLLTVTEKEAIATKAGTCWSRAIWDVSAVAWLLDESGKYILDRLEHSPIPEYDDHYSFDKQKNFIRYVYYLDRDAVFRDLFDKLSR
jgi:inosine-uridine nucleoside N-ribohydrolase